MECPNCGNEMVFEIMDDTGAHYECRNCGFEYTDKSIQADVEEEDEVDENENAH